MPVIAPPTFDDLGVRGCFSMASLLMAHERRIPVMPNRRSTLAAMHMLRELGVIDAPWPDARWEMEPRAEDTPIEQIQWRYTWDAYLRDGLLPALSDYLQDVPRDDYGLALRLRIWEELVVTEAERFFESQLAKYNLESAWAQDLTFAMRESKVVLPIAQWRYCCWAATRFAAAQAQRHRSTEAPGLREDTFAELTRRAGRLASGDWDRCSFVPFNPRPESAASRLFVESLTGLGPSFWTLAPSLDGLLYRAPANVRQA